MSVHRTVDRVVDVLDLIARAEPPMTVSEVARAIGAPVSSVHDLVGGLVDRGWLRREGVRLRIGAAPLVLDLIAQQQADWSDFDVEGESERLGLPMALAVRVGHHVIYTQRSHRISDERLNRLADRFVPRSPLTTAAGRLLLAFAPDTVRRAVIRTAAPGAPELVQEFERLVPEIRRSGTAWSDGLADGDVAAAAVLSGAHLRDEAVVVFGRRNADRTALRDAVRLLHERIADGPAHTL